MAEIDLEKKRRGGAGWIWLLLALAVIAIIFLWAWPAEEPEVAFEDAEIGEEVEPIPPRVVEPTGIVVTTILMDPAGWVGRSVEGEVQVAEVPTDRGFWITEGGERLFVVIDPVEGDAVPDVNPDSMVHLENAVVRDASFVAGMTDLDEDTRQILEGVDTFLVVDGSDVEVMQPSPT